MSKQKHTQEPEPVPTDPTGATTDPAGKRPVPEMGMGGPVKQTVDHADRPDATQMPDELARIQAEQREPDPGVAMLKPKRSDPEGPSPGPPDPPTADAGGPLPRLIHQNERATPDTTRYKIRCINYADQPQQYILARKGDREGARQKYVEAVGLQAVRDAIDASPEPRLTVRELPD